MQKIMQRAPGEWLTVREAARRYGITTAAVRAAIYAGRLPDERNEHGLTIIRVWQADELWQYRLLQSDTEWVSGEEWTTVPEIANRYQIDRSYVYELIRLNRLTAKRGTHNQLIVPAKVAHELWENRLLKAQGLRQCKACLKVKPLEEFAKSKKPRRRMCRTCINKMMRRWKMARMMRKIWGRG